jgi:DNA polymerase III alpha subunit
VHYARARDRMVHDVLSSCGTTRRSYDGHASSAQREWYLKGAAQIARRWRRRLEGVRATIAIADQCRFRLDQLEPTLPAFACHLA